MRKVLGLALLVPHSWGFVVPRSPGRTKFPVVDAGRVDIEYCTGCKWLLRASWVASELLQTFDTELDEVSLIPSKGAAGTFEVRVDGEVVWDRVVDGGFPGPKELKQRVRNIIAPDQDLGHIDSGGSGRSGGARASLATPSTSEAPASAGTKTVISSDRAPAAVGAYSQAIRAGNLLFCSGQVGLDPATGKLAPGGVAAEAEQAMTNLREVVEAAGGSLQDIVKTTVLLADISDYKEVNTIYSAYFKEESAPARACFAAGALPIGAKVEIEAIVAL
mmetsp:Transcript_2560/g.10706  ORF Transcript_2560/g.10706 Transcript_2560/m.10706 type:complete len:276 (-) Transcript_2560:806-1633(-)